MSSSSRLSDQVLQRIAHRLRIESIRSTTAAGSGHPTSCASICEAMAILFFDKMRYSVAKPKSVEADRLVLSKGHAAPVLYAAYALAGQFAIADLMNLRKIDSVLEGHPTPRLDFIDVATGSLGQGLGCAAGMAWAGKYLEKLPYRVYCILGDGESAEGSVWEAMAFASHYELDNLVCVIDCNRLGQSEAAMTNADEYGRRVEAFGWKVRLVEDGNKIEDLRNAFDETNDGRPYCIVMKTQKGAHMEGIGGKDGWHGKPLSKSEADCVIVKLKDLAYEGDVVKEREDIVFPVKETTLNCLDRCRSLIGKDELSYKADEKLATRKVYGDAVARIGRYCEKIVCLDGDTKNSTFAITFKNAFPHRFIECFIAEQNMLSVASGLQCREQAIPFVSGFACFLTRGFDQLRMAAISCARMVCVGSHAGCSIGEDGGSQMGLEDIAMFRSLPNSVVLYPSDAVSCQRAVELAAFSAKAICYIRTSRPNFPLLYKPDEQFNIGQSKVVRSNAGNDAVTLVAGGVTLIECLKAYERLKTKNVFVRVIDVFSIKPLDAQTLIANGKDTGEKMIVVEDHYAEGGIGEAVAAACAGSLNIKFLCVRELPHSGKPEEILAAMKIDANAIFDAVMEFK